MIKVWVPLFSAAMMILSTLHADVFPTATWQTKTPQEVGLDPAAINNFAAQVGGDGVIVKDGYLVKTWGDPTRKADWASAAKPVMSTMMGFAIKEGKLQSPDDLVRNWNWNLSVKDQPMTFRHLANMMSGYTRAEAPGAAWAYNDYAINLYAKTLFGRVFTESSADAAVRDASRLGALQFQDGAVMGTRGGYGLQASPRDFARIGWFWLKKGNWNGQQLLPKSFFDANMVPQVPAGIAQTQAADANGDYLNVGSYGGSSNQTAHGPNIYGFNWWFNPNQSVWPDAPADLVQANGHFNREILIFIPSLNIVAAARGNWGGGDPDVGFGMNEKIKILVDAVAAAPAGPLNGQIIVDPNNPAWLVYNRDSDGDGKKDPFFLAGPGDPEDFLYRGDQTAIINKLKGTGANSIYMQAVRSHGGDGAAHHNPFINSDPAQGLDQNILDQWETWFTEMDNNGIVIYFFIYDDGARIWNTGDVVGPEERAFLEGLVNRFKHHKHLIWCIAEEYGERYSVARIANMAQIIRAADNHKHVLAVHQNHGNAFQFANDPNIDQFAIQMNVAGANAIHTDMVGAWNLASGRFNLNMSESSEHYLASNRAGTRQYSWAAAMGGAYVMAYQMDVAATPLEYLQDLGRMRSFFENTIFNEMAPHDELAHSETQYVLAKPGQSYIAYGSNISGSVGLKGLTGGNYDLRWFNPVTGATVNQSNVSVPAGDRQWSKPSGMGNEIALWVHFRGGNPPPPPPPTPTAATPTISPNGGTFSGPATVTLQSATSGAQIRYTTNGTNPTATSLLYSAPFSLSVSATVKAKAFRSGYNDSAVAQASFVVNVVPPPPPASEDAPSFKNVFNLALENTFEISCRGSVKIVDRAGRLVRELTCGGDSVVWDGKNHDGTTVSAGVYIVLRTNEQNQRVVVIK